MADLAAKRSAIRENVTHNIFIREATRTRLLDALDGLSEQQVDRVQAVLDQLHQDLVGIFAEVLKRNPNFFTEVKHLTEEGVRRIREEAENKNRAEESGELDALEKAMQ